jgi:uncharacterized repeat protein (TIGR02543 family)
MKAQKLFLVCSLVMLAMARISADTISGSVTDSISGIALDSVKITTATPSCTTFTDTNGNFKLIIPFAVGVRPSISGQTMIKIEEKFYSLKGTLLTANQLPAGVYVKVVKVGGKKNVFKFMNSENRPVVRHQIVSGDKALAKKMQVSRIVTFQKTNYLRDSLIVVGSQNGLIVKMVPVSYALTLSAGIGGIISAPTTSPITVNYGVASKITAVPNANYFFLNWLATSGKATISNCSLSTTTVILTSGDATIQANFSINTYALTTVATNGSIARSPNQASYNANTVITLTAVPVPGYMFTGWSGDLTGSTNPATITMNAAKNVTANFSIKNYALTITAVNGSVTKSPNQDSFDSNTVVTLTPVPAIGYQFGGWGGDLTGVRANPAKLTMNSDKNVTAKFNIKKYAIAIIAVNGTVALSPDQNPVDSNTVVTLTAMPAAGYHFESWNGDITGSTNPATLTMNSAKNVTANFVINNYPLAITAVNGSVTKSPNQNSFDFNTVVTLTAIPATGYRFIGWSGDLIGVTNPATLTIDTAKNVTANFATIVIGGPGTPAINLTYVPPIGSYNDLQGTVVHVDPKDYAIVVYLKVGYSWYVKPFNDLPVTNINVDGSWTCDVTTGGTDQLASEYRVYLIPAGYIPSTDINALSTDKVVASQDTVR